MTESKKIPGMLKDPWRTSRPMALPTTPALPKPDAEAHKDISEVYDDFHDSRFATIELKGYGGITVDGTSRTPIAVSQVLDFCVDNLKKIEETLLHFGILVVQLEAGEDTLATPFYIRRADGWTLAVPEAKTRDAGCLQLIQAMVQIYCNPTMRHVMATYRIRPYKM